MLASSSSTYACRAHHQQISEVHLLISMATATRCRHPLITSGSSSGNHPRGIRRRARIPLGQGVTDGGASRRTMRIAASTPAGGRNHDIIKRSSRHLITIGTSDGRWQGNWSCDYLLSLRDLRLGDLVEEEVQAIEYETRKEKKNDSPAVAVNLWIQKHASFGLSIDGRIITSFTRKCSHCSSPYCRQVDAGFTVWVLPYATSNNPEDELPEIGGDDPSVIYVKPGGEAHLDSLIQDTLRLTVSANDTCSETCARSETTYHYIGGPKTASIDKRWSRLLELRKGKGR